MSKTAGLLGAVGAFGALAYLLAPLPPEAQRPDADAVKATASSPVAPSPPAKSEVKSEPVKVARVSTASPAPATQDTTVRLVQQSQTELLRLGCYNGAVDGHWSPETQQAMHALGARVRVLRPVDTPDYIMLALARSQVSHICAPKDQATASHQPARIVPMAGPWETRTQRMRAGTALKRAADRAATAESRPHTRNAEATETAAENTAGDSMISPRDRATLEQNRMGLGAAAVDPLRAGIDPRDPTAPAILRGPPPVEPRTAIRSASAELDAVPSPPPRASHRSSSGERYVAPSRSERKDWRRAVFNKLRESGP